MKNIRLSLLIPLLCLFGTTKMQAQELKARVTINHSQVSETKVDVFDALEKKMTEFLNDHAWTEIKFRENEKIQCNFHLTVNTYSDTDNSFTCTLLLTANRPVWGSNYMTTSYSVRDAQFNFTFREADQLEYNPTNIDNNLVALMAYSLEWTSTQWLLWEEPKCCKLPRISSVQARTWISLDGRHSTTARIGSDY